MPRTNFTRRQFTHGTLALLGGTAIRCAAPSGRPKTISFPSKNTLLPQLEVKGSPHEMGEAAGKHFAKEIKESLQDRGQWWIDLKTYADSLPPTILEQFEAAAQKHTPAALSELRGWAAGSGVP